MKPETRQLISQWNEATSGKICAFAKLSLSYVFEHGLVSSDEIRVLRTVEGTEKAIGYRLSGCPLLTTVSQPRFWSTPIFIQGKPYYLNSQWFKKMRGNLILWLQNILEREPPAQLSSSSLDVQEQSDDYEPPPRKTEKKKNTMLSYETFRVSFGTDESFAHTKPVQCVCLNTELEVSSWSDLYLDSVKAFYHWNSSAFSVKRLADSRVRALIGIDENSMRRPMAIAKGLYLECNYSATAIVKNLGRFLDFLFLRPDALQITAQRPVSSKRVTDLSSVEPEENGFIEVSKETSQDDSVADIPTPKPEPEPESDADPVRETEPKTEAISEKDNPAYTSVLRANFGKGFRLGSPIEVKRFRKFFHDLYGMECEDSDKTIERTIGRLSIVCEGKAFLPETLLSQEAEEQLLALIQEHFDNGCEAIYYTGLFTQIESVLLRDTQISSPAMLKDYIDSLGKWYSTKSFFSTSETVVGDIKEEIQDFLVKCGRPVSLATICEGLPHLSEKKIHEVLKHNSDFIRTSPRNKDYFHESLIAFSDEELDYITNLLEKELEPKPDSQAHPYIAFRELKKILNEKRPEILEPYAAIPEIGIRDALKYKLSDRFNFIGGVISSIDDQLSKFDVFREFAQFNKSFTFDQVKQLADDLDTYILFQEIEPYAIRISENQYVSNEGIEFDVEGIDNAIDALCPGKYIPFCHITDYSSLPETHFPWNEYLFAHYLSQYSQKFDLWCYWYNRTCLGMVVRCIPENYNLDYVLADLLVNDGIELTKEKALDHLCNLRIIGQRKCSYIDSILEIAQYLLQNR